MNKFRDYRTLGELGKSIHSVVYKARKNEGEFVALKKIENRGYVEKHMTREFEIMEQKLKHINVVKIYECFIEKAIFIAMEYCELGDLNKYTSQNNIDLHKKLSFMIDMARGVNYLHTQNIVHRDLKPDNVLLTTTMGNIVCKISDFGASRVKLSKYDKFSTYTGTFCFMAPEVTGDKTYSHEVDIYSLGLIFFSIYRNEIFTDSEGNKFLMPGIHDEQNKLVFLNELMQKEKPTQAVFVKSYFADCAELGDTVFHMLNVVPEERSEMEETLVSLFEIREHEKLKTMTQTKDQLIITLKRDNEEIQAAMDKCKTNLKEEECLKLKYQMENKLLQDQMCQKETQIAKMEKQIKSYKEEYMDYQSKYKLADSKLLKVMKENDKAMIIYKNREDNLSKKYSSEIKALCYQVQLKEDKIVSLEEKNMKLKQEIRKINWKLFLKQQSCYQDEDEHSPHKNDTSKMVKIECTCIM